MKGFSLSPRAAPLSYQAEKNKAQVEEATAASRQESSGEKKKLAIKQERIGFLHPNENSSWEIDESVWKHNSILAIMRSHLRNWVYIPQVGEKSQGYGEFQRDPTVPWGISPFQLLIRSNGWILTFRVHACKKKKKTCSEAVMVTTSGKTARMKTESNSEILKLVRSGMGQAIARPRTENKTEQWIGNS